MWSPELQSDKDRFLAELERQCSREIGSKKKITRETDPCSDLGICDEDLDDIQVAAAAALGMRPPLQAEALVMPWHGPDHPFSLDDLAGWLAANCRAID